MYIYSATLSFMNRKSVHFHVLILLFLFFAVSLNAQSRFKTRIYSTYDGLSHSYVLSASQDNNKYLWVSTRYGLSLFDGAKFTNVLYNYKGKELIIVEVIDKGNGKMLLWSRDGSHFILDGKNIYPEPISDKTKIPVAGYEGIDYWVKIETPEGCFYNYPKDIIYVDKKGVVKKISDLLPRFEFVSMRGYWDNQLYLFTNNGVYTYKDGRVRALFQKELSRKYIYSMIRDRNARIWVSTAQDGILISEPRQEDYFDNYIKLSNNLIGGFYEDKEGNMWICTFEGLVRVRDVHYESFTKDKYPFLWDMNLISKDRVGNILLFSESNGLIRRENDKFLFNENNPFKYHLIDALCYDDNNHIWCVSRGKRVLFFDGEKCVDIFKAMIDVHRAPALDIDYDHFRKKIWLTSDSLMIGDEKGFSVFKGANEKFIPQPSLLAVLSNGKILMTTLSNELALIDRENNIHYLENPDNLEPERVHAIFTDSADNIWMSYIGSGLLQCKLDQDNHLIIVNKFTKDNGLKNEVVKSMAFDKQGRLWLATMAGIDVIDLKASHDLKNPIIFRIDKDDNMPETGLEYGRLTCDNNNNMWYSTQYAIMKFEVNKMQFLDTAPPVTIENIRLNMQETDWSKFTDSLSGVFKTPINPILKYYQNTLTLNFKAVSMVGNGGFQYSYMVRGLNNTWSPGSINDNITLTKLPPGRYTFLVRARKTNSDWCQPASFSFTIKHAIWQHWWFNPLLGLIFAGIIYSLYRFRLIQIRKEENIRRRLASDLHDDIGSTLSSISYYSEAIKQQVKENSPQVIRLIDKMEKASDDTINAMSDIVWAINPLHDKGIDMVNRMETYATELCRIRNIELLFESDKSFEGAKLKMEVRKNLFLIYKEAVNNALKYSDCTRLNIRLAQEEQQLLMRVQDNGKGFDSHVVYEGNGLKNMQSRAREIKGDLEVISQPGGGCSVTLKI